jgi:predicted Zn finger-like uncharacterized protein
VAVVTCPKCQTSLRIADGVSGNVKCPKCNTVFLVATSAAPTPQAVVPAPPKPAAPRPAAAQLAARKAVREEPDFEVVDEPKPKKKVTATIEEDEADEPRKKNYRDDDDDDEEDDRPRKKKKSRRYDDDEEDDWQPRSRNKIGYGKAQIGVLLLTISSWLYFSLYVLLTICLFIALVTMLVASESSGIRSSSASGKQTADIASLYNVFMVLIGLIGLANWIVSLIGFAFCIAGPQRTRVSAITVTSIAGVHLIFVGLSYGITSNLMGGFRQYSGMESPSWLIFATTMPFLNSFLPMLVYGSRAINGEYIVLILTGVLEVVRLIFTLLLIRPLAVEGKNHAAAEKAQIGVVASSIIVGGGIFLMLFIALLLGEAKFTNFKTPITIGLTAIFLLSLAYTVMLIIPAITAGITQHALAQRNR